MCPCPGTPISFPVAPFFVFRGVLVLLLGTSSDKQLLFSHCSCPPQGWGHVFHRREHVRQSRDVFGRLTFVIDIREKTKNSLHG